MDLELSAEESELRDNVRSVLAAELGADHAVDIGPSPPSDPTWIERYLMSFGGTISAGSSEIQRNIIAEKVLGLPR
jgi:hypothetical protein